MVRKLVVAVWCLALAACGSTVGDVSSRGAEPGLGDELGAPRTSATTTGGDQPQSGLSATARATVPGTSGTRARSATTTRAAAASGPVRVGLLYLDGADSAASSLGISALSTGDAAKQSQAIVAHLNARGGLHGRAIDLRLARMSASRLLANPEATHAAACASLVQDQKVSYVVSYLQLTSSQVACYAKSGVMLLDDQSSVPDGAGAEFATTFASPGELALGRASSELVDALWRRGWLTPASKIGTFVYDSAEGIAIETKFLKPALARHGLAAAVSIRSSTSVEGANQSGAVLQYRAAGVDRMIPIGANPLFLMNAAESQGYRPAYAMTSTFGPGALLESSAPPAQLRGAAGIGWSKFLDIGRGTDPGAVSANETLCFKIMTDKGLQSSAATVRAFQVALCNVLMFLKAATDTYGLDGDLLNKVRTHGLAFPPADAFGIRMTPGRADGVSIYRDIAFDAGCGCFQYMSGNRPTT